MIKENRRRCPYVVTKFKKQANSSFSFHLLFFISLILLFCISFMLNTLILSLDSVKINDQSLSPIVDELLTSYTQMKGHLLITLSIAFLGFFSYQQRLNKKTIEKMRQQLTKRAIVRQRLLDNGFLFGVALLTIFLTILLFPSIYQDIIIQTHSSLASHSAKITNFLENSLVEASSNHIVLRFTTMQQVFKHLFYFSPEKWTRLFFESFLQSGLLFSALLIGINSLVTTSHLFWLANQKKTRP